MLFSSLIFLFSYLPFLLIGNYLWRNRKWQNVLLFIGSLFFYAWGEKEKVFVMLGSILVNYLIGLLIDKATTSSLKKRRLAIGIIINLGVLVYFKYAAFLVENGIDFMANFGIVIEQHIRFEKLPIGISFYTFQSISYLIDVYRRETPAQKDFIKLGLYIALFPQLIAGPIIRYVDISKQLLDRQHSLSKFNDGIKRFISGLGKKLILANSLAYPVDEILALPADEIGTALAWTAMLGYTLQIYFDFSGYSDMAIGLGKMFGFTIPENFNYPFISKSIREFWNRWHISLSTWFKDYLYIPLGGNRNGKIVTMRNLIIVFLITGLWHGASWSFIAWGLLHGIFMIVERLGLGKKLEKVPSWIQNAYALFVVVLAFVWFRVENIHDALIIQKSMFGFSGSEANFYAIDMFTNAYFWTIFVFAIAASVPWKKAVARFTSLGNRATNAFHLATALFYGLVFLLSILAMVNSTYSPFIYFRF